jgi:chemotaxis methyl-accepting protein methylase
MESQDLKIFLSTIQRLKGIDLSSYRQNFLLRRLNYRIKLTESGSLLIYLNLIKKDNAEFNRLLDSLAINVSEFFRDPGVFDYFRKNCLHEIMNRKGILEKNVIRIWSAGCAEGQEVYSLAIMLKEELGEKDNFLLRIWATDMDEGALQSARKAEYDLRSLKEINKVLLAKYFTPVASGLYRLNDQIKKMVNFSRLDLVGDLPLKYMDAIFCRNVMIYFSRQQQDELLLKLYKALNHKGYLVIGKVETIWGDLKNKFISVNTHNKIFQKRV